MKPLGIFIVVLLIAIVVYLFLINKKAKEYAALPKNQNVTNYNYGAIGVSLANLIANTKCGKEGRPPCTKAELQASGWTDEQIAQAEQGSLAIQDSALCQYLGINC